MKRVYAVMDESSDWYVIPIELKDKFFELDEKIGSENLADDINQRMSAKSYSDITEIELTK